MWRVRWYRLMNCIYDNLQLVQVIVLYLHMANDRSSCVAFFFCNVWHYFPLHSASGWRVAEPVGHAWCGGWVFFCRWTSLCRHAHCEQCMYSIWMMHHAKAGAAFAGSRVARCLRHATGGRHNSHCARRVRLWTLAHSLSRPLGYEHTPQCSPSDPYVRYCLNRVVSLEND